MKIYQNFIQVRIRNTPKHLCTGMVYSPTEYIFWQQHDKGFRSMKKELSPKDTTSNIRHFPDLPYPFDSWRSIVSISYTLLVSISSWSRKDALNVITFIPRLQFHRTRQAHSTLTTRLLRSTRHRQLQQRIVKTRRLLHLDICPLPLPPLEVIIRRHYCLQQSLISPENRRRKRRGKRMCLRIHTDRNVSVAKNTTSH